MITNPQQFGDESMSVVKVLQQVELFRGLSLEQLEQVGKIAQEEKFSLSDVICRQGDRADKLYIISSGQVEISVSHQNGHVEPVVYLGAGQVVGEMTLVDAGRRSASVIAVEEGTVVYSIPNEVFSHLCETDTAIGYLIMRNIAQDMSFKLRHHDYEAADND
jgi:CRP/FNR family cyclic AMP-dependent transcriptional regulator